MKLLKGFGLVALTCLALGMSGCASYQNPGYASDYSINRHVKDRLAHGSTYAFPNVSVQTHNGVVELDGYVDTPQEQTDAEQLAASVPGVQQVIDNLRTMAPLAPTGRVPIIRRNYP